MKRLTFILAVAAACGRTGSSTPAPIAGTWAPQTSGTTAEFRGLAVINSNVVWASGTAGRVVHTTDGGRTWRLDTIPGSARLDFRAIAARSATHAWAMAAGPAEQN